MRILETTTITPKHTTMNAHHRNFLLDIIGKHFLNISELKSGKIIVHANEYIDRSHETTGLCIMKYLEGIDSFQNRNVQCGISHEQKIIITFTPFTSHGELQQLKQELFETCIKKNKEDLCIFEKIQAQITIEKLLKSSQKIAIEDFVESETMVEAAHIILWSLRYICFESALEPQLTIDFLNKEFVISVQP